MNTALLSEREAARLIGCARQTLRKAIDAGQLATAQLGERRYVTRESLERLAGTSLPVAVPGSEPRPPDISTEPPRQTPAREYRPF